MSSKRKYPGNPNYGNYKEPPKTEKQVDKEKRNNIIKLVVGIVIAVGGFLLGIYLQG
jgi:hypothetical protein